jgi:hypothetical protein
VTPSVSIFCNICHQSVDLTVDRLIDEENKPVHQVCYEQKIIDEASNPRFIQAARRNGLGIPMGDPAI